MKRKMLLSVSSLLLASAWTPNTQAVPTAALIHQSSAASEENWLQSPHIRWSLQHMNELTRTKEIQHSSVAPLPYANYALPQLMIKEASGQIRPLEKILEESETDGFLVLHQGKIVYERYWNHMKLDQPHATASLSKVFTGLLVSMLAEEGKVKLSEKAQQYIPELAGTVFGKATIQQLLDMEVSAQFPTHGFRQKGLSNQDAQLYIASGLLRATNGPTSIHRMLQEAKETAPPGITFSYNNGSTETLGWVVRSVTGHSLSEEMSDRIWKKLGTEGPAYYVTDRTGVEQASAGLNVTLRDMAHFGEMIRNNGSYNKTQIVSPTLVKEIFNKKPTAAFQESDASLHHSRYSYHNQWWLAQDENGKPIYEVTGSYGQRLYIHPASELVIVHFASNTSHNKTTYQLFSNIYKEIIAYVNKKEKQKT